MPCFPRAKATSPELDHQLNAPRARPDRVKEGRHVPALCVMPRIANLVAEYANSTSVALVRFQY